MKSNSFVTGMHRYIQQLKREGRFSTAKSYQDALRSFSKFRGTLQIPFSDIDRDRLRTYEAYLLRRNCLKNTISTYMRRIRCIYNQAVDRGEARPIRRILSMSAAPCLSSPAYLKRPDCKTLATAIGKNDLMKYNESMYPFCKKHACSSGKACMLF